MHSYAPICLASELHFLNIDMWNTLWTYYMFGGRASSYANFPIRLNTSKGPTIRGLSFPFFPNLIHPFQGIPLTLLGPLFPILCPFVSNQHTSCSHLGLLPAVLWLDLLYPWSFGLLRVRASCALQLHPNIREIDIVFPQRSHKTTSRYLTYDLLSWENSSALSDHSKFFQVYCTDSYYSF